MQTPLMTRTQKSSMMTSKCQLLSRTKPEVATVETGCFEWLKLEIKNITSEMFDALFKHYSLKGRCNWGALREGNTPQAKKKFFLLERQVRGVKFAPLAFNLRPQEFCSSYGLAFSCNSAFVTCIYILSNIFYWSEREWKCF